MRRFLIIMVLLAPLGFVLSCGDDIRNDAAEVLGISANPGGGLIGTGMLEVADLTGAIKWTGVVTHQDNLTAHNGVFSELHETFTFDAGGLCHYKLQGKRADNGQMVVLDDSDYGFTLDANANKLTLSNTAEYTDIEVLEQDAQGRVTKFRAMGWGNPNPHAYTYKAHY